MRSSRISPSGYPLSSQRLWLHLQSQRSPQGGTVLNLILAVLGLGVLWLGATTFLLPKTFSCGGSQTRAARQIVETIGRRQQAYYLERQQFAKDLAALNLEMKPETKVYRYRTQATDNATFGYAEAKYEYEPRINGFWPFEWVTDGTPLRSYVSGIFLIKRKPTPAEANFLEVIETVSIVCEVEQLGPVTINPPTYRNGKLACGKGSNKISR